MVHDHDLCCPRTHKYYLLDDRICTHRAGWRCVLDGAFVARAPGSRIGIAPVNLVARLRERQRNRCLDSLIVASRFMRQEMIQNGFAPHTLRILPPVPTSEVEPTPLPAERRVLFVGQLLRGKGVDFLLAALRLVRAPFTATLVGDGNARPSLERLALELGLQHSVHFAGWVPHQELGEFYRRAKVVVVPSRWPEPFGLVGVEAMLHARPVAAFAVGGIPDWLADGKTGILAPAKDVGALAKAIGALLDDSTLAARLGAAGRQRAMRRYSFDGYLTALEHELRGGAP